MSAPEETTPAPLSLDTRIYTVRGQSVMLDSDLAEVYQVETKSLNRSVRRNLPRFPERFAFQLEQNEWDALRCQFGTSNVGRGGRRHSPWVFTEHGAVMLASVLNSPCAIQASIVVIDAFVRLRHILDANRDLAHKIDELSTKVETHDKAISVIFRDLEEMTHSGIPERPKERIGFKTHNEAKSQNKRKQPL